MKKALVWQTAQKSHGENANEVHIVNYHWGSPLPRQVAGSQSLSRWVCWPSHHKPWLNTREFTGAHRASDDKRLGLGDGKRKRDLYILFSPHGATYCPWYSSSMATNAPGWKAAAQTQVPQPDPLFLGCHMLSTQAQQEAGHTVPHRPSSLWPEVRITDHADGWITIHGIDGIPVITKALCKYERTSVTRRQINICSHYTGRNWGTERLRDLFYTTKVNSRARKMITDNSHQISTLPGFPLLLSVTDCNTFVLAGMRRKHKTQSWDWAFILVTALWWQTVDKERQKLLQKATYFSTSPWILGAGRRHSQRTTYCMHTPHKAANF